MKINKTKNLFFIILILLFFSKIQATPNRGLVQCGSTCYMNASLQCLCSISGFNEVLIANKDKYAENSIASNYITVIQGMRDSTKEREAYNPKTFAGQMAQAFFGAKGSQQDAGEFLRKLLANRLMGWEDLNLDARTKKDIETYLSKYETSFQPSVEKKKEKLLEIFQQFAKTPSKNKKEEIINILSKVSGDKVAETKGNWDSILGEIEEERKIENLDRIGLKLNEILKVDKESEQERLTALIAPIKNNDSLTFLINTLRTPYFNFWQDTTNVSDIFKFKKGEITWESILSLPIPKGTLIDCLDEYNKKEIVEDQEGWKKRSAFHDLPKIFIVALSRFKGTGKDSTSVSFPLEGLDMRKHLSHESTMKYFDKHTKYNLIGTVIHSGSLGGGHYWAYTKDNENKWYKYNDSDTPVIANMKLIADSGMDKGATPYVLFYQLDENSKTAKQVLEKFLIGFTKEKLWEYVKNVVEKLGSKIDNIEQLKTNLNGLEKIKDINDADVEELYKKLALLVIDGAGADLGLLKKETKKEDQEKNTQYFKGVKKEVSTWIQELFGTNKKAPYLSRLVKTYQSKLAVDKFLSVNGDDLSDSGKKWQELYMKMKKTNEDHKLNLKIVFEQLKKEHIPKNKRERRDTTDFTIPALTLYQQVGF